MALGYRQNDKPDVPKFIEHAHQQGIKISEPQVRHWLAGRAPQGDNLKKLAAALSKTESWILFGDGGVRVRDPGVAYETREQRASELDRVHGLIDTKLGPLFPRLTDEQRARYVDHLVGQILLLADAPDFLAVDVATALNTPREIAQRKRRRPPQGGTKRKRA